ncbi:MAG: FtsX-like permease family protein [Anaerolineales bacterium]|nr:FtsX-like permease family protein [Anaerolineales bacterium]
MNSTEIKPNKLKPRWNKVIADLWDNKMRTLLVVASIAVGVFSIGMIVSAYAIIAEDIDHSYALASPVNIEIWTDPFYEDFVNVIEHIPGVAAVEGRQITGIRASNDGKEWQDLGLIAITDFRNMQVNQLSTISGTQYPGRRELLVSTDFMADAGFQVGDHIQVELANGDIHTLPLVGVVGDQVTDAGDFTADPKLYITMDTLESLGIAKYYNRLFVRISGDGSDEAVIETLAADVEYKIERSHREIYRCEIKVTDEHPMGSLILAVLGVLGALGGLITFLSGSLIINTLNALLAQHLRQIGIMKLVGGRSFQILGMYMALIFTYGLISLIIAVPTGAIAGYAQARYIAYTMNATLQEFRVVPIAIIIQVLIAFLLPLGAGFFPVNKGSKTNVRRAITNDNARNQSSGLGWINRITMRIRFIARPIMLSIRNTFRQTARLLLTIFTLTVAGAIFIAVFNVRISMTAFMDQLSMYFMGDVTLSFSQPYPITRIEKAAMSIPGVASLEGWGGVGAEIWDEDDNVVDNMFVIAPPYDTALVDPDIIAGRWLNPGEEKAVVPADTIYSYYPDIQPGDKIIVKVPGQREEEWTVVGIFRFVSMVGDTLAYADYDYVADMLDLSNQAFSYRVMTEEHSLEKQKEVAQKLDKYFVDHGFEVNSINPGLLIQEENGRSIDVLVVFLLIMALLTAFVGSIGLTGTMGMNVLERTREIGVMRAIGAVDLEITKSVVIEGVMIGLITWFLAIGVSFPISEALLNIISESMMGSSMDLTFAPEGVGIWLVVVILLSIAASILPARNAARLTINEVLAYE